MRGGELSNIGECWEKKHATFMIMGDTCNARVRILQREDRSARRPRPERASPRGGGDRDARPCARGGDVGDRDDLADGGAAHFARSSAPYAPGARPRPSKC